MICFDLDKSVNFDSLHSGDIIRLNGKIITGRDAAHGRLVKLLEAEQELPLVIKDRVIYYTGPCPPLAGQVIGACGPTTSGRMDVYTPLLMRAGLKGMIGKGPRSTLVKEAIVLHQGVYFAATGGAGSLLASCVKSAQIIAFADLGAEAIFELTVEDFPLIVAIDSQGNDLYASEPSKWINNV